MYDDDEEEAATVAAYDLLSKREVPECFETKSRVCRVNEGVLESCPIHMRLVKQA